MIKIDKKEIPPIKAAIANLASNPRPPGYKKLKGEDAYRLRIGKYRVIYEIDDHLIRVTVISVGRRKDIYK